MANESHTARDDRGQAAYKPCGRCQVPADHDGGWVCEWPACRPADDLAHVLNVIFCALADHLPGWEPAAFADEVANRLRAYAASDADAVSVLTGLSLDRLRELGGVPDA